MEYFRKALRKRRSSGGKGSLNPCCNGILSKVWQDARYRNYLAVLILVVMEYFRKYKEVVVDDLKTMS